MTDQWEGLATGDAVTLLGYLVLYTCNFYQIYAISYKISYEISVFRFTKLSIAKIFFAFFFLSYPLNYIFESVNVRRATIQSTLLPEKQSFHVSSQVSMRWPIYMHFEIRIKMALTVAWKGAHEMQEPAGRPGSWNVF